jgi:hypothetical protein
MPRRFTSKQIQVLAKKISLRPNLGDRFQAALVVGLACIEMNGYLDWDAFYKLCNVGVLPDCKSDNLMVDRV